MNDTNVTVTVNGATSDPFKVTVLAPNHLVARGAQHMADPMFAYESIINYTITDKYGDQLPADVPVNESWSTGVTSDFAGMNWRQSVAGSFLAPMALFADHIQGEANGRVPQPLNPQNPLGATKVYHWGHEWWVGSLSSGSGRRVQTDTLQKYQDHALHLNIVTPAP